MKFKIFVVDDDRHYGRMLSYRLEKNLDNDVHSFSSGEACLERIEDQPDLVLLDIMMPGIGGLETLKRIRADHPNLPVVMVSAQGVIDVAIESMQLGAYDYITKGQDDLLKLDTVVKNVREKVEMERELSQLRGVVTDRFSIGGLVGESPAMKKVNRTIEKTLRGDLTVAIQGESGTGKELVAKAIHYGSNRKDGPFVVVNCAAIPRELMESEFFGHEKGSFTGAHARKIGKFEQANGGTIFLDEIGELDLDLQAKLLRALQSFEIVRVGGNETIRFDSRVISATNKDVENMIQRGTFREDLYYRLFQFPVLLPPLRARGKDIILLANHFLRSYIADHPEFAAKRLTGDARRAILEYAWPGNVRELKSAVERAILVSDNDDIELADLMLNRGSGIAPWSERMNGMVGAATTSERKQPDREPMGGSSSDYSGSMPSLGENGEIISLDEIKRQAIERAYRVCEGNVDRAAVELGIGRATMYRLLKKYDVMA
ncbi:MAG: sigma-54-dependent Fis family transcriptional regulator [Rhodothermales bacterium]|nr:sigma-54-dependent Fis family transcriptional regulator [Rhodothermales bacterium]